MRLLGDARGRPIHAAPEREAPSRGAAVLALEAQGALPDATTVRAPLGPVVRPDAASHARYGAALERHMRLDERV
jgi:hypothetical protein